MKIWIEMRCEVCGQAFQGGAPLRWFRLRRMIKVLCSDVDLALTRHKLKDHVTITGHE